MAKQPKNKTSKSKKIKVEEIEFHESSGNIFEDFGYSNPKEAEAKSDLAFLIRKVIKDKNLTQVQAANLLGIDQPKISKICRGQLSGFTIERLMNYLIALGIDIEIKPTSKAKASIHVTKSSLRRLNA